MTCAILSFVPSKLFLHFAVYNSTLHVRKISILKNIPITFKHRSNSSQRLSEKMKISKNLVCIKDTFCSVVSEQLGVGGGGRLYFFSLAYKTQLSILGNSLKYRTINSECTEARGLRNCFSY